MSAHVPTLIDEKCGLCERSYLLADLKYVFCHKPDALTKTRTIADPRTGEEYVVVMELLPKEAVTKVCLECYEDHRHGELEGFALVPWVAGAPLVHILGET